MKKNIICALLASTIVAGFKNDNGWKMDGENIAVDGSGNPIYIDANGNEQSVKHDTIANLNREAKTHREEKETAQAELAKYRDKNGKLIDPEAAVKAIDTVSKIDAKTLIDAGEVDKVRETIKAEYTQQITERDNALAERDNKINAMLIDGVFKGSEFINQKVAMPRDFFEAAMKSNFKVEDGKVVAYDKAGNRMMSKKNVGDYADADEALELLVESHPQRDTILKAPDSSGSGNQGGGGNRGGSRTVKRSEFDAATPAQKAEYAQAMTKGEISIVD